MKLKPKPQKPKRKQIEKRHRLFDGDSVEPILNFMKENGVDPSVCRIDVDYGYGDVTDEYYICCWVDETDKEYQKRYDKYKEDLNGWYKWYNENKKEIKLQREKEKKIKELQKEYKKRMIEINKM